MSGITQSNFSSACPLQRWNFPFKSLEIAKYYLRTADYTTKGSCGIYEIENSKGRVSNDK